MPALAGVESVITHPYEGGHPDHDSAAFAVQAADFRRLPPPGAALYDRFGWRIESAAWRCEAARTLAALELA